MLTLTPATIPLVKLTAGRETVSRGATDALPDIDRVTDELVGFAQRLERLPTTDTETVQGFLGLNNELAFCWVDC